MYQKISQKSCACLGDTGVSLCLPTQAVGAGHTGQQQEQAPHLEEELDAKAARSLRAFVYDTNNKC